MSEEFKKEEINGEAAEETKAAEHTEEVKAETTAEQSAAETEKPQETAEAPKAEEKKTTTYSWVNPKISGKTGEENNSASYTGKPDPSEAKAEQTSSAKTEHYQYQSQTQSAPKQEKPQFSAVPQPQDHKKKAKKPMSDRKKMGHDTCHGSVLRTRGRRCFHWDCSSRYESDRYSNRAEAGSYNSDDHHNNGSRQQ